MVAKLTITQELQQCRGALVVAHNVILANFTDGPYFEAKQQNYRSQHAKFLPLLRGHFVFTVIDSTWSPASVSQSVSLARRQGGTQGGNTGKLWGQL